jgi:hypothetical protein
MKKILTALSFLMLFTGISSAKQQVSTEYGFYDREENDYHSVGMSYSLRLGGHTAALKYSTYLGEDEELRFQRASIAYFNFGDKHLFGGFAGSASDKPFNTVNVLNAAVLYGYSVHSKVLGSKEYTLPDGRKISVDRKSNLYIGIALASQPVFLNTYFFPLVSYFYMGENFQLRLGVPGNGFSYIPSDAHKIDIEFNLTSNYKLAYEFTPTQTDKLTFFYGRETEGYVLSEYDDRDMTMWYQKDWLRLSYERIFFDFLSVEATAGYMHNGNYYRGESFHSRSYMKLPKEYLYGIKVSADF